MAKIKYEIDPHNRLIVKETGRKTGVKRFRKVIDGRFKIDKDRTLTYHIKVPSQYGVDAPHQIKLRGEWSLSKNHDLRFTLNKWQRQSFGDQLTLKGDITDASKNSLVFAVTTRTKDNVQSIYTLRFKGAWQADESNRLVFRVNKKYLRRNVLIFTGKWEVNKKHEIVYKYQKQKQIHTLIFKGHWDIKEKVRLAYIIDKNSNSVFNFRAKFVIFKDRYIKYELGMGLYPIVLFGKWKIEKNRGLLFEIEYRDKKVRAITFGVEAKLTSRDTILFKLKNDLNKDIGVQLKLSRKMLKGDGEAFLRLLKSSKESAVFVGAGKRW